MIVLLLVVLAVVVTSFFLGRISHEVESARDTEYVEIEGRWVRYEVAGGGPPVLLVHGWLSSSKIWEPLVRRLAQRFTVYTLDLTGFGESDKPTEGYGVRYGSRLLYAFCARFGLTRTAVVGHDVGGAMAVKLAADHPDIVGRLVLVATPAEEDQIDLPTLLWITTLPVVGPLLYVLGGALRPVRRLWMRPFVLDSADLPPELVEDAGRSTPAAAAGTFKAVRHEISGGRLARQARIIKVPVLLAAGEEDQIVDPRAVSDWGQNATQAEIALFSECGHLPMVEAAPEFGARVLAFLTGDNGYLEYVKEVPSPAEDTGGEELHGQAETGEPETAAPEARPGREKTFFSDLVWDFDSGSSRDSGSAGTSNPGQTAAEKEEPAAEAPDRAERAVPNGEERREDHPDRVRRVPPPREQQGEEREPGRGRVPEFPEDLFRWSEPPGEFSPGQRSRRTRGERETSGDDDSPDPESGR